MLLPESSGGNRLWNVTIDANIFQQIALVAVVHKNIKAILPDFNEFMHTNNKRMSHRPQNKNLSRQKFIDEFLRRLLPVDHLTSNLERRKRHPEMNNSLSSDR